MEIGESAAEGAIRETWEEANAEVEILSPFAQLDIPLIGQVRSIRDMNYVHQLFFVSITRAMLLICILGVYGYDWLHVHEWC